MARAMSAANVEALAERVLLLAALRARVERAERKVKAELAQAVPPGSLIRPMLDGEPLGSVSRTAGTTTATVADAEAFAEWMAANYPEETDLRVVVKEAATTKVLEISKAAGIPLGPGGEVAESAPAGIRVSQGVGTMVAIPRKDAMPALWSHNRERLAEIIREIEE